MQTVLFHQTIFGPIHSRRLGTSLGVNLSPNDGKVCSLDCLYCEAGYNAQGPGTTGLPARAEVGRLLEEKLSAMAAAGDRLDVITFSGNGEPTLHPDFEGIIDDVVKIRDRYFPHVKISVLCNSTRLSDESVCRALRRVDNNILKLDSAVESTMRLLDRPNDPAFTVDALIPRLVAFGASAIIQTMITRGSHDGHRIDNSTDAEVDALIEAYRRINPASIMLYTIDRPTPERSLQRVPRERLDAIAARIKKETGIKVCVAG